MKNNSWSKRELLRDCYQAWKTLNYPARRGYVFPSVEVLQKNFNIFAGALDFIGKQGKTGTQISTSDIAIEINWLAQQS